LKKNSGFIELFNECMKMRKEKDEVMLKKLDVGDALLDTINLHNLAVPF